MKVVVAGGSGALGRRLCDDLAMRGHDVVMLPRSRVEPARALVDLITTDDRRAVTSRPDPGETGAMGPTAASATDRSKPAWLSLGWWLRNPDTGEVVVFQPPNAAMITVQAISAVQLFDPLPDHRRELGWAKSAVLVVWAGDELARGSSPIRRLMGAVTLAWQLRRFVR